jgi:hypothetical protein
MPIVFRCPACGQDLEAPDDVFNAEGACRFCGAHIVSPSGPDSPATLIAPAASNAAFGDVSQPTGSLKPFQILSEAWSLYQSQMGLLLLGTFIVGVINAVLGQVVNRFFGAGGSRSNVLAGGIFGVLLTPFLVGPYYIAARTLAGRRPSFRHWSQGIAHADSLIGAALLLSIPWFLASLFLPRSPAGTPDSAAMSAWFKLIMPRLIAGTIIMSILMIPVSLTTMEIVDRGSAPIDAIRASLDATRGHYLAILGTRIVLGIAAASGLILCCFGITFTVPISIAGEVVIYRHLRGLQGTPDA